MTDGSVIRLFEFTTVGPGFDEILRSVSIPRLCAQRGIVDCVCARQGPEEAGPRIVVSVWQSEAAMLEALADDMDPFPPDALALTADRLAQVFPLRVGERFPVDGSARILRVFRGRVVPGSMALYEQDMRAWTGEADGDHGPVAVYMAEVGSDELISLSTWRDWRDVEAATEGDIARPRVTRNRDRLVDWHVRHFEIIGMD
jgi:heme-degrading monooxygenase HmoA